MKVGEHWAGYVFGFGSIVAWVSILLLGHTSLAFADAQIRQHKFQCAEAFPCPDELLPRVNFWANVYSNWSRSTAVFHDRENPGLIYEIVENTDSACSKKTGTVSDRTRQRLKNALNLIARNTRNGHITRDSYALAIKSKTGQLTAKGYQQLADRIRCQSGVKEGFYDGLQRFGGYAGEIDNIVRQYGLPADIRYLPFVESLYRPDARSKAGAGGLWQIMPKTAKWLGMTVNDSVDERFDVVAATHGAAKYLVDAQGYILKTAQDIDPSIRPDELYPFVITSYNYGIGAMRGAIKSVAPDYMRVINEHREPNFQVAVKNFYASFLAARHVAKNADLYFGDIKPIYSEPGITFDLPYAMSINRIKKVFKLGQSDLEALNPSLTRKVWRGSNFLPKNYALKLPHDQQQWRNEIRLVKALKPESNEKLAGRYRVKKGDTACEIAYKFRVRCSALISYNKLGKRAVVKIGQLIKIPNSDGAISAGFDEDQIYRVREGDSLCKIAQNFDVGCPALRQKNNLKNRSTIHPGQKLLIPS